MKKKRNISILLLLAVLVCIIPAQQGKAAASTKKKNIKTEAFVELMVKTAKLPVDMEEEKAYQAAALAGGLVKEGETWNWGANITNADAAILASRADELLHGEKYDEASYDKIVDKKRISDLGKIPKEKQPASTAKLIAGRVKTPSKRRSLSPDGQLIRTRACLKNAF